MVKCPSCGEENRKEALFCRKCGEKLQTSIYVKRREPWGLFHIGVVLVAVIMLIAAFGLVMGGTSLRSIQEIMTDEEGYIMSNTKRIQVSSYGVVVEDMDIDIDPVALRWFENRGGFLSFKMTTESNNPEKAIFVGVARKADAYSYIEPMEYHNIVDYDFGWEPGTSGSSQPQYMLHPGDAPTAPPTVHSYWIVQGAASGPQTIVWEPEAGNYYLVLMNADGSRNVDADIKLGVEVPFFAGLGNILLTAGLFVGGIAVLMLYFTIKRNQP